MHGTRVRDISAGGNLLSAKTYDNFILRFEFMLEPGSNNGMAIRSPKTDKSAAYTGMEIQILDGAYDKPLKPAQYHGSIYDVVPAKRGALRSSGNWNTEEIIANGRHIKVTVNGVVIVDTDLNDVTDPETLKKHPGLLRESGHIGFLGHNDYCEFTNIRIKELPNRRKLGSPFARDNQAPSGFTALFNGHDLAGWQGVLARPNDNPVSDPSRAGDAATWIAFPVTGAIAGSASCNNAVGLVRTPLRVWRAVGVWMVASVGRMVYVHSPEPLWIRMVSASKLTLWTLVASSFGRRSITATNRSSVSRARTM